MSDTYDSSPDLQNGKTVTEATLERLREMLIYGRYGSGQTISEYGIQRAAGLKSRAPIREALSALVSEGLIEQTQTQRRRVRQFSPAEKSEIVLLRKTLEELAITLLVQRIQGAESCAVRGHLLQEMEDLLRAMTSLVGVTEADSVSFLKCDAQFHTAIATAAGLPYLAQAISRQICRIFLGGYLVHTEAAERRRTLQEHTQIMDAVREGHLNEAVGALSRHIKDGGLRWGMLPSAGTEWLQTNTNPGESPPPQSSPEGQPKLTDAELVSTGQEGDFRAVSELLFRHQPLVYRYFDERVPQKRERRALFAEFLAQGFRTFSTCPMERPPVYWILELAAETLHVHLNRRMENRDLGSLQAKDVLPANHFVKALMAELRTACDDREQITLILVTQGNSFTQVSELLEVSSATVRTCYLRGQQKLLSHLVRYRPDLLGEQEILHQAIEKARQADNPAECLSPEQYQVLSTRPAGLRASQAASCKVARFLDLPVILSSDARQFLAGDCLSPSQILVLAVQGPRRFESWSHIVHVGLCPKCLATYTKLRTSERLTGTLRQNAPPGDTCHLSPSDRPLDNPPDSPL